MENVSQTAPSAAPQSGSHDAQNVVPKKKLLSSKLILVVILILTVIVLSTLFISKPSKQPDIQPVLPIPSGANQLFQLPLAIESPSSGQVAVDDEILVKGNTLPDTTILIFTENDEVSLESDSEGNFEETITLAKGVNLLNITAIAQDGQEKTVTMSITN